MQCKSDPLLQYWKSPTDLQSHLDYKVNVLNPGIMTTGDVCLEMLQTNPLGPPYRPFLQTMEAIRSALEAWFEAIQAHPKLFTITVCNYSLLAAMAFLALADDAYPLTINDPFGFSPLMDMRYGLAWCLHCDQVLKLYFQSHARIYHLSQNGRQ
jgi:hypothetical protein